MIAAVISLGINAARSIDIHTLAEQIMWGEETKIAAVAIFAAIYLVIAIGKLPHIVAIPRNGEWPTNIRDGCHEAAWSADRVGNSTRVSWCDGTSHAK